jgi:hypothetical protein
MLENQQKTNNSEESAVQNDDFLRKKKAKEEALLRYINESDAPQILEPEKAKTTGEMVKEALVGIFGILYMLLLNPIIGDKKARNKLFGMIFFRLLIFLLAFYAFMNMSDK